MPVLSPTMTIMIRAAERASRSLLRDFNEVENLQVSKKGPGDFVSAADKRSEEIIHEELLKGRPDYAFLMEESGASGANDAEYKWIVDPLDGTTNFLHGLPHWCISIGLEHKGEIVAGLIFDPVKNEMFHAEKGNGAFIQQKKRLRVSERSDPLTACIATGMPARDVADKGAAFLKEYAAVMAAMPGMRRFGAAALDMAYVAAGRFDGFWEKGINAWDVAAGSIIVREAGGFVEDPWKRENPIYCKRILAGNMALRAALTKAVTSVGV